MDQTGYAIEKVSPNLGFNIRPKSKYGFGVTLVGMLKFSGGSPKYLY